MVKNSLFWIVGCLLLVSAGCSGAAARNDSQERLGVTRSALGVGVTWIAGAGISVAGSNLTKTGVTGWNADAHSSQSLSGNGSASFTTGEANTFKMAGLSTGSAGSGYAGLDFAVFLTDQSFVEIYEDGALITGAGYYVAGDVFGLQVAGGVVTYVKNGTLLYTSKKTPSFPLFVSASLYSNGATINNASIDDTSYWQNVAGVNVTGQSLTKVAADGWNAGASTIASLSVDGSGTFTTAEANTYKMAGLTHLVTGNGFATIDFALFLTAQGLVDVYENGTLIAEVGSYVPSDVFAVRVAGGVVTYVKNGTLLYTSTKVPTFPLYLDASLYSNGATIDNVAFSLAPYWQNVVGVTTSGTSITKTGTDGWNAGASTIASLGADGSVSFQGSGQYEMVGLTHTVADSGYATIDFAFFLTPALDISIYEDGTAIAAVGTYVTSDVFAVQVTAGVVTYRKNGTLLYTSTKAPSFPLVLDASLYSQGASISNVSVSPTPFWQNELSVTTSGHSLTKFGPDGWNGGASTIASWSVDGTASFTTAEATTYKMAGLTNTVTDNGYATIDFALYLTAQGQVDVYEDGTLIAAVGSYVANDVFGVQITAGVVTYLKNGTLLYTSTKVPSLPLYFDASLYSSGATVENVAFTPAAFWQNANGVTVSGQSITKTGPAGWNAGASSITSLSGDGHASFTTGESNTYKMAGLTHVVADSGFSTIDFGFFMTSQGVVHIYEDGTAISTGFLGYGAGSVLRVQVTTGIVQYVINGSVVYTSTKTPTFPLYLDASLYTTGATIQNAALSR